MKKVICSLMLGMFITGATAQVQVEASWLSKTWKKVENSLDTESTTAPPSVNRQLHDVGHLMDKSDLKVVGVPIGATFDDVKASLGSPQYETTQYLQYGGIKFSQDMRYNDAHVASISISNRDATTAREIAVGDTLKQVVATYGQPDFIMNDYYFYGYQKAGSDWIEGIYFYHDGKKVKSITVFAS